jgi:hypothetical protein
VIELSARATLDVARLEDHFDKLDRPEAIRNLAYALAEASAKIEIGLHTAQRRRP